MRCPAKCRRVGMADDADSKSVGGNTVWVQVPPPAPRRNGLCSIQKAQPVGWAFLIPLRHSSFSPRNFASQIFAGALAALPGGKRASCVSLAATFFVKVTGALILLLLASKPDPLSLVSGLGPPLRGGFVLSHEDIDFNRSFHNDVKRSRLL